MSTISDTKQKLIDASIVLFNAKGYDGVSIREIANRANVNISNISYYFRNKDGLLEHLVQTFFEGYLLTLENVCKNAEGPAKTCLFAFIHQAMKYHMENIHLARLVYREITKDTILIREVMTTYLAKEKFYLKNIIDRGISQKQFQKVSASFVILQLRGFLCMPFLQTQYILEVLHLNPYEDYFLEQYIQIVNQWVEKAICFSESENMSSSPTMVII